MALTKQIKTATGFTANQAYGRVVEIQYCKPQTTAKLFWFKDQESAETAQPISKDTVTFSVEVTGDNFVAQAYNVFKKLEHLSDATDC
jgi:hypothetical protein